jgi:hypothetical protein
VTRIAIHIILVLMRNETSEARRELSYALFNNRYVSDVVIAIQEVRRVRGSRMTVRMLARQANLPDSLVRPVVLRFVQAGVLDRCLGREVREVVGITR